MATQTINQKNWWMYFTKVNQSSVKCDICNTICGRVCAPVHLYRSHNITNQKVILKWNNNNHFIWQYFTKKDLFTAKCKFCGTLFTSAYRKENLDTHMRVVHPQIIAAIEEEITHTWVSPYFTFDNNCNINCTHCDYSVKIYGGVDVLKNHLNKDHNIYE